MIREARERKRGGKEWGLSPLAKLMLLSVPFLVISAVLTFVTWNRQILDYGPTLLALNVAIAIFSVNISVFEFMLSPYHSLIDAISIPQLIYRTVLILLSLLPCAWLINNSSRTPSIVLITMPLVVYGSIFLVMIARYRASPEVILANQCSDKAHRMFLDAFSKDVGSYIIKDAEEELSIHGEMPVHEYDVIAVPPIKTKDTFSSLVNICQLSITQSDIGTYESVVQRALEMMRITEEYVNEGHRGIRLRMRLLDYSTSALSRISIASGDMDVSGTFITRFVELCSIFVWSNIEFITTRLNAVTAVMEVMLRTADRAMTQGRMEVASFVLATARQAADKWLKLGEPDETGYIWFALDDFARTIKCLGQGAVRNRDNEFLFYCLDSLGFLGCSAVNRSEAVEVARSCIYGLAQLGRESRASDLDCPDVDCLARPEDHAEERLGWIMKSAPEGLLVEGGMIETLQVAFSRLRGKVCTIALSIDANGERDFKLTVGDAKYIESKQEEAGTTRIADFSDPGFVKELKGI